MSKLSYMEKLLDGVEVEWKMLWEVTVWDKKFNAVEKIKQPQVIKYHYFLAKDFKPLVTEGGAVKLLTTYISDQYTTEGLAGDKVTDGEIVAIPWGGNPVVQYYKGKFLTSDNRIATSNDVNYLNNKYLYYFLLNKIQLIESFYRGSGIKHPCMASVLDMEIPIPYPNNPEKSLEIQTEIVRILDTFTELTAELSARKKQYHYYRDQLLSFDEGEVDHLPMGQGGGDRSMSKLSYMEKLLDGVEVEWKTLEDVFNIKNGYTPSKSKPEYWSNGDIPWFRMDDIRQNGRILDIALQKVSKKAVKGGKLFPADSIIFSTSATIGEHALIKVPYLSNQQFTNLSLKSSYSDKIKFLFYYSYLLCEWCKNNTRMSSFATVDMNGFKKLLIPIPYPNNPEKSLEIQTEIVRILDKFDTLTSSISEGLPLEIKLRQQQYEYYRNLLLSFPKPEVAA